VTPDHRLTLQAWGISGVVHGLVLLSAFALMAQVRPLRSQDTFRWEVSLVEAPKAKLVAHPVEAVPSASPPPSRMKPEARQMSAPQVIANRVHTHEQHTVIQRDSLQVVETPRPIERTAEVRTRQNIETQQILDVRTESHQVHHTVERPLEPTVQSSKIAEVSQTADAEVIESASPVNMPVTGVEKVVQRSVVASAMTPHEPVQQSVVGPSRVETKGNIQSVARASSSEEAERVQQDRGAIGAQSVESRPMPTILKDHALDPQPRLQAANPGTHVSQGDTTVAVAPQEVAKATQPRPAVQADYRWLAESLWRRVAELKRYPSAARLNGWEGRVVLRAVIRSDGHLADISVQKSSGYDALDKAAIEAVRLACPLHMKHELGRGEVAVSLPIVYSLSD
jgi:protein TonB